MPVGAVGAFWPWSYLEGAAGHLFGPRDLRTLINGAPAYYLWHFVTALGFEMGKGRGGTCGGEHHRKRQISSSAMEKSKSGDPYILFITFLHKVWSMKVRSLFTRSPLV